MRSSARFHVGTRGELVFAPEAPFNTRAELQIDPSGGPLNGCR